MSRSGEILGTDAMSYKIDTSLQYIPRFVALYAVTDDAKVVSTNASLLSKVSFVIRSTSFAYLSLNCSIARALLFQLRATPTCGAASFFETKIGG